MKNRKSEAGQGFWFWVIVAVIALIVALFILVVTQGKFDIVAQKLGGLKYG